MSDIWKAVSFLASLSLYLLIFLSLVSWSPHGVYGQSNSPIENPSQARIFVPLLLSSGIPDLLVRQIELNPGKSSFAAGELVTITVVIENRGNAPAHPFWVDLYFNPTETPRLNRFWNTLCGLQPCLGMAWVVSQTLMASESITLTSTADSYSASHTYWPGWMAAGTTDIYVLADSWNAGRDQGISGESDRSNNLLRLRGLLVSGPNPISLACCHSMDCEHCLGITSFRPRSTSAGNWPR